MNDQDNQLHPRHWGGHRVKETATHYVDVMPMLYNDRIVLVPKTDLLTYEKGWCYPKGLAAMVAASLWDPNTEPEPQGWIKEVHTGRRAGDPPKVSND